MDGYLAQQERTASQEWSSSHFCGEDRQLSPTVAGQEVRKLEVLVDEIGPSLRWAEAQIQRRTQRAEDAPASEEASF
jgi:hypothetical protein